jgi:hypothetical protein
MRFQFGGLAPVLVVALGLGCSSKSSPAHDASSVSEAGALDGPHPAQRDAAGIDLPITEAGGVRDTKPAPVDATNRDGKADAPPSDAAKRDTSADGKRDVAIDTTDEPDLPVEPPRRPGTCGSPIEIPYTTNIEIAADTTGADHSVDFPCVANGADVVFKVRSDGNELVYADTFDTAWNTALFFSDTCPVATPPAGEGMAACNDDACGTTQSQAFAILGYGYHYLIVSGVGGASGPLKLHYQSAPLGNGVPANLPAGAATVTGSTSGSDSTRACDMAGPKSSYWWTTCPTDVGGPIHASTCQGADWDAALILQVPRIADGLTCADDDQSCGVQATLDGTIPPGAGIAVLTVTGNLMRSWGSYTLTYSRP